MFGTVDKNGTIRFSGDIQACRRFLRSHGLEIVPRIGWTKPGWLGILEYWKGAHHAAIFQSENAPK